MRNGTLALLDMGAATARHAYWLAQLRRKCHAHGARVLSTRFAVRLRGRVQGSAKVQSTTVVARWRDFRSIRYSRSVPKRALVIATVH